MKTVDAMLTERLITKEELAQRLGFSARTVLRWVKEGIIPCIRVKRFLLFNWRRVLASLEKYEIHSSGQAVPRARKNAVRARRRARRN